MNIDGLHDNLMLQVDNLELTRVPTTDLYL